MAARGQGIVDGSRTAMRGCLQAGMSTLERTTHGALDDAILVARLDGAGLATHSADGLASETR